MAMPPMPRPASTVVRLKPTMASVARMARITTSAASSRSPSTIRVPVPVRPALMAWMRRRCMMKLVARSRNQKKPMLMRTQMVRE